MVREHERILYTVSDIAGMLGISDAAVRMHVFRRTDFLPEPIRAGTKRLVWTREQLEKHFRSLTPAPTSPPTEKKLGRPTKRESLRKSTKPKL